MQASIHLFKDYVILEHYIDCKIIKEEYLLNSQNIFLTTVSPLSSVDSIKWAPQSVVINGGTGVVRYSSIHERKNTTAVLWIIRLLSWWTWQCCGTVSGLSLCFQFMLKTANEKKGENLGIFHITSSLMFVAVSFFKFISTLVRVWISARHCSHGPDLQGLTEKKDRFKA